MNCGIGNSLNLGKGVKICKIRQEIILDSIAQAIRLVAPASHLRSRDFDGLS